LVSYVSNSSSLALHLDTAHAPSPLPGPIRSSFIILYGPWTAHYFIGALYHTRNREPYIGQPWRVFCAEVGGVGQVTRLPATKSAFSRGHREDGAAGTLWK